MSKMSKKTINIKTINTVKFGSLAEGDMFMCNDNLFIKTVKCHHDDGEAPMNAVYVSDGDWAFFSSLEDVESIDVEINVKR